MAVFIAGLQEMFKEKGDVCCSVPQRREGQGHHVEAIIEVSPEQIMGRQFLHVDINARWGFLLLSFYT
ncbi:MAG: hypothetical protein PF442_12915 [Desulfobulbaceae bacterium]|jgi:hypothetical protein|nr:hypothetical protein [Desulfobulbaceae bacterium]